VIASRHFQAMGTEVELYVDAADAAEALDAAEAEFHRLESILTRFRPESELSRLNAKGALEACPELREVVGLALAAREDTGGRFDPTVHDAVVSAGYDRTFDDVPQNGTAVIVGARCGGGVLLDGERIVLDEGVRLDLGGIGKGYAAARAAELLSAAGAALVNAGGDVAVRGGSWPVGVPTSGGSLTLELNSTALATSGRDRRRWRRDDRELHHLIDPATGVPSESDLLRLTVVAPDAVDAEVWAKALYLVGEDEAVREADERGLPCVLVTRDGRTRLAGGLA
jgi:thiamine biosynthesis lipoprotein